MTERTPGPDTTGMSPALVAAIDEWRHDPRNAEQDTTENIGGCHRTARRLAACLHNRGVAYRFLRYGPLPGWITDQQNVIGVEGFIVDGIALHYRPTATFPHALPVDVFEAEFGAPIGGVCERCGATGDTVPSTLEVLPLDRHVCFWAKKAAAGVEVDGDDDLARMQRMVETYLRKHNVSEDAFSDVLLGLNAT